MVRQFVRNGFTHISVLRGGFHRTYHTCMLRSAPSVLTLGAFAGYHQFASSGKVELTDHNKTACRSCRVIRKQQQQQQSGRKGKKPRAPKRLSSSGVTGVPPARSKRTSSQGVIAPWEREQAVVAPARRSSRGAADAPPRTKRSSSHGASSATEKGSEARNGGGGRFSKFKSFLKRKISNTSEPRTAQPAVDESKIIRST